MRQLFEEYGGPILAALAIVILIGIIKANGGTASTQFDNLTGHFYDQVTAEQYGGTHTNP